MEDEHEFSRQWSMEGLPDAAASIAHAFNSPSPEQRRAARVLVSIPFVFTAAVVVAAFFNR
jgi:hypothetical protein